jgi:hypothetical protein
LLFSHIVIIGLRVCQVRVLLLTFKHLFFPSLSLSAEPIASSKIAPGTSAAFDATLTAELAAVSGISVDYDDERVGSPSLIEGHTEALGETSKEEHAPAAKEELESGGIGHISPTQLLSTELHSSSEIELENGLPSGSEHLSIAAIGDEEREREALELHSSSEEDASEAMKSDREFMLAAVKQNWGALEDASEALKSDRRWRDDVVAQRSSRAQEERASHEQGPGLHEPAPPLPTERATLQFMPAAVKQEAMKGFLGPRGNLPGEEAAVPSLPRR